MVLLPKDMTFGPHKESKAQAMLRLAKEGRKSAFDSKKAALVKSGMTAEEAWETLLSREFVPLTPPITEIPAYIPPKGKPKKGAKKEDTADLTLTDDVPEFEGDPLAKHDGARDALWVYNNFEKCYSPPPSPGARSLLDWARSNRTAFFKDVLPKLKPTDTDDDGKVKADDRKFNDIIHRFEHANKLPDSRKALQKPLVAAGPEGTPGQPDLQT